MIQKNNILWIHRCRRYNHWHDELAVPLLAHLAENLAANRELQGSNLSRKHLVNNRSSVNNVLSNSLPLCLRIALLRIGSIKLSSNRWYKTSKSRHQKTRGQKLFIINKEVALHTLFVSGAREEGKKMTQPYWRVGRPRVVSASRQSVLSVDLWGQARAREWNSSELGEWRAPSSDVSACAGLRRGRTDIRGRGDHLQVYGGLRLSIVCGTIMLRPDNRWWSLQVGWLVYSSDYVFNHFVVFLLIMSFFASPLKAALSSHAWKST